MIDTHHVFKLFTNTSECSNPTTVHDALFKLKALGTTICKKKKYSKNKSNRNLLPKAFINFLEIESESFIDASFIIHTDPEVEDKVNDKIRDNEITKLIDFNKVYFNLPIDIICFTVAIIDRFIAKVKVKPKYVGCLMAACMQISAERFNFKSEFLKSDYLASLLRFGATSQDLDRLRHIVDTKLRDCMPLLTVYDGLKTLSPTLFCDYRHDESGCIDRVMLDIINKVLCNFRLCMHKPSHLALAIMCHYNQPVSGDYYRIAQFIDVDLVCRLSEDVCYLMQTTTTESSQQIRSKLVWIISRKTLIKLNTSTPPFLTPIQEEPGEVVD